MMSIKKYFMTGGDATSQFINAWLFNSGNANQSLSGRCDERKDHWFFGRLGKAIDFVALRVFKQENHCYMAYLSDVRRADARIKQYKARARGDV